MLSALAQALDTLPDLEQLESWWASQMPNQSTGTKDQVMESLRACCRRDVSWATTNGKRWQYNVEPNLPSGYRINFQFDGSLVSHLVVRHGTSYLLYYHE
jgi:hypothetical protein